MTDSYNGKSATQDDVAARAGVSRSIVSYVINNGPRKVSEETRKRVLDAIKELGYRPNKHAQMLSSTDDTLKEKYIGIILAGHYMFKRPYYGSILASIHEYAHQRDCHIRFIHVFDDFSNPALFNELIHPDEINGIILLGLDQVMTTAEDSALIGQIIKRVERVVCVEWEWSGVPSIQFDRQNASYQSTCHLLASGRNRIAYIGPEDKRLVGYRQALWENGLTAEDQLVQFATDTKEGYERCLSLVQSQISVDAICAGTDEAAIGILHCLHQHGIQVPNDIAITGVDNLDISAFTIPALTTIDVPKYEIGRHAIDILLLDRSRKGSSAFAITVPTELVVRESSTFR
jgi:LacI family transcriptional regulator